MFPCFTRDIQRTLLWIPEIIFLIYPYGAITLFGVAFQPTSGSSTKMCSDPTTPHLPLVSEGIRFALCRVRSPLLTASLLISFPAGTKMFQSPAFPILKDRSEEQEVPLGHRRIKGFVHLPGAYRSLTRPSSALEPSHPPDGVVSRICVGLTIVQVAYDWYHKTPGCLPRSRPFSPLPRKGSLPGCT